MTQSLTKSRFNTRSMVMAAMLGAIAGLLMFVEIGVPFAPPFIKLDLSDLPVLLSGFLFGPAMGVATGAIKILVKLLIKPTSTAFVGELSNFILTAIYVAVAAVFYRMHRTKKGAVIAMTIATVVTSLGAVLSNVYVIFPLFATMMNTTMGALVGMITEVNPLVTNVFTMVVFSLLPFNLFKYGLVSLITFLIYKKISVIIRKYIQ